MYPHIISGQRGDCYESVADRKKQIRKQLDEAYKQQDSEKVVEAARKLSLLALKIIQK